MSQECLHGTDSVAIFQQMGGETMAQGVTATMFRDTGALESLFHSALRHRFRHMVSALRPGARVNGAFSRGKDILPDPRGTGLRSFRSKAYGK